MPQADQFGDYAPSGDTISLKDMDAFTKSLLTNYAIEVPQDSITCVVRFSQDALAPQAALPKVPYGTLFGTKGGSGLFGSGGAVLASVGSNSPDPVADLKFEFYAQFNANHYAGQGPINVAEFQSNWNLAMPDGSPTQFILIYNTWGLSCAMNWATNLASWKANQPAVSQQVQIPIAVVQSSNPILAPTQAQLKK